MSAAAAMADGLRPGTAIAGVVVRQPLGRGGFGITYLAEEPETRRRFALKEYFPADLATRTGDSTVVALPAARDAFGTGREAFFKEASILKCLPRRPGLVKVRGAFEKHGTVYCLMEFIEGEPLSRIIARFARERQAVPEALAVDFTRCLASALGVVHASGLIHRDIKPANVMIRRTDGQPVLIDFGASRQFGRADDLVAILTREYAPIEQFPLDWAALGLRLREGPWSDLFSLSVLLYGMLAHRLPPDARARLLGLKSADSKGYVPLARAVEESGHGTRYSARLTDLVDYGCNLFPADRPADAEAFADLLDPQRKPDRSRLKTHLRFGTADDVSDLGALKTAVARVTSGAAEPRAGSGPAADRAAATPPAARDQSQRALVLVLLLLLAALAVVVVAAAVGPFGGGAT